LLRKRRSGKKRYSAGNYACSGTNGKYLHIIIIQ
jgi:hypothetical protein